MLPMRVAMRLRREVKGAERLLGWWWRGGSERTQTDLMECVPGRGHSSRGRLGMKEEEVAKLGELARIPEEMMGPTMLLFGC